MFLTRHTHEAIVGLLRDQIADKDRQIADLKAERDFYRSVWTARQGERFSSVEEISQPLPPIESRSEESPARIDAAWGPDDRDIFLTWAKNNRPSLMNETELLEEWKRDYGGTRPLDVAVSGSWKV